MAQNYSVAESLALLPESEREAAIRSLTNDEALEVVYDWRGFWARENQLPPPGDWSYWLLMAGRGFGKTRVGAETVREWASKPLPGPIHLIAPTAADIRKVMIEGPNGGLLSCYPPGQAPHYEPSKGHQLTWPNGNIAYCFSADEPERLRGPQCCRLWADELAAWRFAQECWDNAMFGFRIGDELRAVITTTPKPIQLLKDIIKDPSTAVTRGSTYDNRNNLSKQFFKSVITKYEGTRVGRQELLAELLEDVPGALWTRALLDAYKVHYSDIRWDLFTRIVVAIDPAVTAGDKSDETGICVAGLTRSLHVVIFEDCSCKESPLGWARVAVGKYRQYRGDRIVGEVNNGGDLVAGNIHAVAPGVPFRAVRASRGKAVRAEPVAALYEQGRVHHVIKDFEPEHGVGMALLEDQMCSFVPGVAGKSPDRMDALVWAVTELLIDQEDVHYGLGINSPGSYQISPV